MKKKIVIASDSFKGTLSSMDICHLFQNELKDRDDILPVYVPIADGGEGSLEAIASVVNGQYIDTYSTDLYFKTIKSHFYMDDKKNAYIEAASCVGLTLANKDNDPGKVTTFGLGEQIKDAIRNGAKNIYIFLGGSASNDGGVGLAAALGTRFFDKNDKPFIPMGLTLKDVDHIDNSSTEELLKNINIIALSDVQSPFYGLEGAAYKFAPQKGASDQEVKLLDDGLKHLADIIKRDLRIDISNVPGSGAAGGLGGGLLAFANAKISSGINTILDIVNFDKLISDADYIISGEGKLDRQTFDGKVIDGIAKRCEKKHRPLILLVGISEASLEEVQSMYPCVYSLFETNYKHLPFEEVKNAAKSDYIKQIRYILKEI